MNQEQLLIAGCDERESWLYVGIAFALFFYDLKQGGPLFISLGCGHHDGTLRILFLSLIVARVVRKI